MPGRRNLALRSERSIARTAWGSAESHTVRQRGGSKKRCSGPDSTTDATGPPGMTRRTAHDFINQGGHKKARQPDRVIATQAASWRGPTVIRAAPDPDENGHPRGPRPWDLQHKGPKGKQK